MTPNEMELLLNYSFLIVISYLLIRLYKINQKKEFFLAKFLKDAIQMPLEINYESKSNN
jgi:hypothetical protein|tara:strand:+ start:90 stop:266 length:177 start_codon:yes stop_codon:yes gene_type:complete